MSDNLQKSSDPFPWIVVDDVFTPEIVRAASAEWPDKHWPWWHVYGDGNANKFASKDPSRLTPAATKLIDKMASLSVSHWFDRDDFFPDFTLHGAGMHCIAPGGFLKSHLDSDHHPTLGWTRELSGVLFLNKHWQPAWGGQLQFLDPTGTKVIQCVEPKFNRLVLFRCCPTSWHQVAPVTCPATESRKTLALFWWSQQATLRSRPTAQFQSAVACAADSPT